MILANRRRRILLSFAREWREQRELESPRAWKRNLEWTGAFRVSGTRANKTSPAITFWPQVLYCSCATTQRPVEVARKHKAAPSREGAACAALDARNLTESNIPWDFEGRRLARGEGFVCPQVKKQSLYCSVCMSRCRGHQAFVRHSVRQSECLTNACSFLRPLVKLRGILHIFDQSVS